MRSRIVVVVVALCVALAACRVYHWVYGALMRPTPDGTLEPDLAQSATVVDQGCDG